MASKQLTKPQFQKYLRELSHTALVASENYEIWWIYKNKEDRPKYIDVMSEYWGFFRASIPAHFIAMLMALSKIYENRNDTMNIYRFLYLIGNGKLIDDTVIKEVNESLEAKKSLIKKICILRSNYFAHISEKLNYDEVLKKANIKYKHFKELIELAQGLLSKISYAYNKGDVLTTGFAKEDTYRLMNTLLKKNT